jgi:hypothetical protein
MPLPNRRSFAHRLQPGHTFKVLLDDGWSRPFTVWKFDDRKGVAFYDAETEKPGAQRSITRDRLTYMRRANRLCMLVR